MKFYRLSGATFYDCIDTIYQFIKPFLDNEMSIFDEYGTFKSGPLFISGQKRCRIFYNLYYIQYNLNGSNTDCSFTVDDSNSFFSPYKILPIAQENKYLGIFSYFIMELYVVCTH